MANHCYQKLVIEGDHNSLNELRVFAKDEKELFSASKFLPCPAFSEDEAGYNWRLKNWGNNWGCNSSDQKESSENNVVYTFVSDWTPAIPVIEAASKRFPNLLFTLKYWESGAGFQGEFEVRGGVVIKDFDEPYKD